MGSGSPLGLGNALAFTNVTPGLRYDLRGAAVRWSVVASYAIGMAYVESAAVLYLRAILGGVDPVGPRHPILQPIRDFGWIEIGREAATIIMLAAVGYLAGSGLAGRIGAFAVAFGIWDIFYYVFLWIACLCLAASMADALRALPTGGLEAAYYARGGPFPWPLCGLGLLVGSAGLARSLTRVSSR